MTETTLENKNNKLDALRGLALLMNIKLQKMTKIRSKVTKYSEYIYLISAQINMFEYVEYCVGYDENTDDYFWSSVTDFTVRTKDMGDLPI